MVENQTSFTKEELNWVGAVLSLSFGPKSVVRTIWVELIV